MASLIEISDLCPTNHLTNHLKSTKKNISRKQFFKWAGLAALIPLYKIWGNAVDRKQAFSQQEIEIVIDRNLPDGVYFYGKAILIREHNNYKLLSAKCSHLGCRINKTENGKLVCPCHGSRFDLEGKPIVGPAVNPLTELDFQMIQEDENRLIRFKI